MHLDDPQVYRRLDPEGMGEQIADLPYQCSRAWREASSIELPQPYRQIDRIVTAGVGGSAIAGDLMANIAALEKAPCIVSCRDYNLPSWVDSQTLVIVSSYSGETEETLSIFEEAVNRGSKVIAVTQGGRLKQLASARGIPILALGNQRKPRAALGYALVGLLGILSRLGLVKDKSRDVEDAVKTLEECLPLWHKTAPIEKNEAKQLAHELHERLIAVYGAGVLTAVARRWKTQFNENSKAWAFFETLPELNHNSIEGYVFPPSIRERTFVVLLSSSYCHPRTRLRYQIAQEVLAKAGVKHRLIKGYGQSPLSQMLSTILLGDYASYYLAMLNGTEPAPTHIIDSFKKRLQSVEEP